MHEATRLARRLREVLLAHAREELAVRGRSKAFKSAIEGAMGGAGGGGGSPRAGDSPRSFWLRRVVGSLVDLGVNT